MKTDMEDAELSYWTQNGNAFFVAVDDHDEGKILGILSTDLYQNNVTEVKLPIRSNVGPI